MLQINHRPTRGNRILVQNTTFCATFSTNGGGGRKDMTFCSQKRGGLKGGYALGFHGFLGSKKGGSKIGVLVQRGNITHEKGTSTNVEQSF